MHDAGMAHDTLSALHTMTGISHHRWDELLDNIASLLPAGATSVVIDGPGGQPGALADRLAATLRAAGRPCVRLAGTTTSAADADRTTVLADGPGWRAARGWDVVIWLRTDAAGRGQHPGGEAGASIVIDLHDPAWPVIRRVAAPLARPGPWYIAETRAFFSADSRPRIGRARYRLLVTGADTCPVRDKETASRRPVTRVSSYAAVTTSPSSAARPGTGRCTPAISIVSIRRPRLSSPMTAHQDR